MWCKSLLLNPNNIMPPHIFINKKLDVTAHNRTSKKKSMTVNSNFGREGNLNVNTISCFFFFFLRHNN